MRTARVGDYSRGFSVKASLAPRNTDNPRVARKRCEGKSSSFPSDSRGKVDAASVSLSLSLSLPLARAAARARVRACPERTINWRAVAAPTTTREIINLPIMSSSRISKHSGIMSRDLLHRCSAARALEFAYWTRNKYSYSTEAATSTRGIPRRARKKREREREREEGGNAWRNPDNKSFLRDNFERCASRAHARARARLPRGMLDTDSLDNLCSSPPSPLPSPPPASGAGNQLC